MWRAALRPQTGRIDSLLTRNWNCLREFADGSSTSISFSWVIRTSETVDMRVERPRRPEGPGHGQSVHCDQESKTDRETAKGNPSRFYTGWDGSRYLESSPPTSHSFHPRKERPSTSDPKTNLLHSVVWELLKAPIRASVWSKWKDLQTPEILSGDRPNPRKEAFYS